MSFGVIYIYPLMRKPCICKKHYDDTNPKYSLKEGDIYYRYGGRSERIRYEELSAIIDESRKAEERQWIKFAKKAAKIGVSNAALLDLNTGNLSGTGGSVFLDAELLKKIAFIQEGKFIETGGTPTLRVIGDVTDIKTGKVVIAETTKKIVRAIEPGDIVQAFLENQPLDEPLEYIKRICSCTSANYPVYFFLQQAHKNTTDAITLIKAFSVRGNTKLKLTARLEGKFIDSKKVPKLNTDAARNREEYRLHWLSEDMPEEITDANRCVEAILYLPNKSIYEHQQYIRSVKINPADFFSTHEYHVRMEQISRRKFAPAKGGAQHETHWFYERARGQYIQATMNLTKAQEKKFVTQNPKDQVVTKTDLAKVLSAWDGYPHYVSKPMICLRIVEMELLRSQSIPNTSQLQLFLPL